MDPVPADPRARAQRIAPPDPTPAASAAGRRPAPAPIPHPNPPFGACRLASVAEEPELSLRVPMPLVPGSARGVRSRGSHGRNAGRPSLPWESAMLFERKKPLDLILATAQKRSLTRQLGAFDLTMLG